MKWKKKLVKLSIKRYVIKIDYMNYVFISKNWIDSQWIVALALYLIDKTLNNPKKYINGLFIIITMKKYFKWSNTKKKLISINCLTANNRTIKKPTNLTLKNHYKQQLNHHPLINPIKTNFNLPQTNDPFPSGYFFNPRN